MRCSTRWERAAACWGEKFVSVHSDGTVAYEITGEILRALAEELPNASVTAAAYEFGTVELMAVANAIRGDHWLHAYGDFSSPLAKEIKKSIRDALYCDAHDWRERIFDQGVLAERQALAMLGAFELTLPSRWTNRLAKVGGRGYLGAFGLGLVCALIAAPCTGPVLYGILAWIAKTQDAALGAAAMASFALGLGAPFFVVGAFAVQLPKGGPWMVHVKSFFGIVLIVVALYFLSTAFPSLSRFVSTDAWFLALVALALVGGVALGAIHRDLQQPGIAAKARKIVAVLLASTGAFLLVTAQLKPARTLAWEASEFAQAKQKALSARRPLLVDFTAAWCIACKELDKVTFADHKVMAEAGRFVAVKVDATDDEKPAVVEAMTELGVLGLPTVVVLDSEGREAARFTDFVGPKQLLEVLRRVR